MPREKKVIFYDRTGLLHCDACGHETKTMKISEKMIGTPCPKCGANMLTAEDHAKSEAMFKAIDLVNAMVGPLIGATKPGKKAQPIGVRCHEDEVTVSLSKFREKE